ncbi:MAG TPA: imidazoleglycerol-phosphate dehydratase, partial [Gemmatimonadetes bacterium]|nr:imidazoleglycerol-phosphate dehydratase [Gemmatimonadota bacterium]
MSSRKATIDRKTNETEINVTLELDGEGTSD